LSQLSAAELGEHSELLASGEAAADYYKVLSRESWLESKISQGGTALPRVREQLELARAVLVDAPGA
jgi:argininosuccinate lyase